MDFKDSILQLSERIKTQKDAVQTEEATKNAFVLPLISALGYDVFNPFFADELRTTVQAYLQPNV